MLQSYFILFLFFLSSEFYNFYVFFILRIIFERTCYGTTVSKTQNEASIEAFAIDGTRVW
jgi:hypothetical protein